MNQQVKQFSKSLLKTLVLNGKWAKMGKIKIKTSKKNVVRKINVIHLKIRNCYEANIYVMA